MWSLASKSEPSLFDDRWRRLERRVTLAIWLLAALVLIAAGLWAFFRA